MHLFALSVCVCVFRVNEQRLRDQLICFYFIGFWYMVILCECVLFVSVGCVAVPSGYQDSDNVAHGSPPV